MANLHFYWVVAWKALLIAVLLLLVTSLRGLLVRRGARAGVLRLFYSETWKPRRMLWLRVGLYFVVCFGISLIFEILRSGSR